MLTLCPLGQPKKAIGHESQIEPWLTHSATVSLARVSEIDSESRICFPSCSILSERSSPSRVRNAAPFGAPWTAPGRSEEHIPHTRESKDRKPATGQANMIMTLSAWKHTRCLWAGPAALLATHGHRVGAGLDAKANFRPVPARWGNISLDIPLYRTTGAISLGFNV